MFEDQTGQERKLSKGVEYMVDYRYEFVCWDSTGGAHMNLLLMWLEIHIPYPQGFLHVYIVRGRSSTLEFSVRHVKWAGPAWP